MELKHAAKTAYQQLTDFHDNRDGYTPETQSYFLSDVLNDLADAAASEGCKLDVPDDPTSIQAINLAIWVLDWLRDSEDADL